MMMLCLAALAASLTACTGTYDDLTYPAARYSPGDQ